MKINGNFSAFLKVSCLSDDDKFTGNKTSCFSIEDPGDGVRRDAHKNSKVFFSFAVRWRRKKCIKRTLKEFFYQLKLEDFPLTKGMVISP